jgi:hypothetical protein
MLKKNFPRKPPMETTWSQVTIAQTQVVGTNRLVSSHVRCGGWMTQEMTSPQFPQKTWIQQWKTMVNNGKMPELPPG